MGELWRKRKSWVIDDEKWMVKFVDENEYEERDDKKEWWWAILV